MQSDCANNKLNLWIKPVS